MKVHKRIILEFTPEEIRLLAYGVIPSDLKERFTEIAYYIDNRKQMVTISREKDGGKQQEKQPVGKKYNCQTCGRPINHKGNCLKCNSIAKHTKENQVDILIDEILKITVFDHEKIQKKLKNIFNKFGYVVTLEKKVKTDRKGRIDLFATKNLFSIGLEIDHSLIRFKSINKLNKLKPSLAIYVLKSKNVNKLGLESRLKLIKTKSLIIYLAEKETQNLN